MYVFILNYKRCRKVFFACSNLRPMVSAFISLPSLFLPFQHVCLDCKKSYCSLCSVLQENLRRCATCHLLWSTAFQRPRLMRLRVKDLRQYLMLRNINTDTCREKQDLVDLVLCHLGAELEMGEDEEEEEEAEAEADTDSLHSLPRSLSTPSAPAARSASQQSALSGIASQGEVLSHSDSSGTTSQVRIFNLLFTGRIKPFL